MKVAVWLFDGYETLDAMGPVEFFGHAPDAVLHFVSLAGGLVASRQGFAVQTEALGSLAKGAVLLVPGGQGTRALVGDAGFLQALREAAGQAAYVLSVCTGSALLAAAGLLDGRRATGNKKAFAWTRSVRPQVDWQSRARWVRDGKFYTSSGVSAGMDMTLGFIDDHFGEEEAQRIARHCEYCRSQDAGDDPFAVEG